MMYPSPDCVADVYECCNCGATTQRFRLPTEDAYWGGVVQCHECKSERTECIAEAQPPKPVLLTAVKPDRAPPDLLRSTTSGIHPLPGSTYARLFDKVRSDS